MVFCSPPISKIPSLLPHENEMVLKYRRIILLCMVTSVSQCHVGQQKNDKADSIICDPIKHQALR